MNKGQTQTFKESLDEILLLIKNCLTSFWFWLPVLFMILLFIQILMFFYIHPLLIFIAPAILSLYAIRQDKKRLEARYDLKKNKKLSACDPIATIPYSVILERSIEKKVDEYEAWIKKRKKE